MQRSLFLRIQSAVEAHDPYFVQKTNIVGTFGLSSLQKITVAMRMLSYGVAADYVNDMLKDIMKACIIMHNMIVEDERDVNGIEDFNYDAIDESSHAPVSHKHTTELMEFIQGIHHIRNRETHSQLQSDLVEHLWQ
ncbi:hypothetical protein HHK36_006365 [Tetracentron sinense]|uniref:Nuclease HARBI1 n=1 Tax=Tetracentron sinense TaxID=13715 RepID=A0A835DK81_TETSI|nr:hypothetical protein HHK36_006365 [Tetracentron sinense]